MAHNRMNGEQLLIWHYLKFHHIVNNIETNLPIGMRYNVGRHWFGNATTDEGAT